MQSSENSGAFSMLETKQSNSTPMEIEREYLVRDPNQDRETFSDETIKEIGSSMQLRLKDGLLPNAEALWVEALPDNTYLIISGETRDRAAASISYTGKMDCRVYTNLTDDMRLDLQAISNNGRKDLSLWEKSKAIIKRLEKQERKHVMALYGLDKTSLSRIESFWNKCPENVKDLARLRLRNGINFFMDMIKLSSEEQDRIVKEITDNTYTPESMAKAKSNSSKELKSKTRRKTKLSVKAYQLRWLLNDSPQLRKLLSAHLGSKKAYQSATDADLVHGFELLLEGIQEPEDD